MNLIIFKLVLYIYTKTWIVFVYSNIFLTNNNNIIIYLFYDYYYKQ